MPIKHQHQIVKRNHNTNKNNNNDDDNEYLLETLNYLIKIGKSKRDNVIDPLESIIKFNKLDDDVKSDVFTINKEIDEEEYGNGNDDDDNNNTTDWPLNKNKLCTTLQSIEPNNLHNRWINNTNNNTITLKKRRLDNNTKWEQKYSNFDILLPIRNNLFNHVFLNDDKNNSHNTSNVIICNKRRRIDNNDVDDNDDDNGTSLNDIDNVLLSLLNTCWNRAMHIASSTIPYSTSTSTTTNTTEQPSLPSQQQQQNEATNNRTKDKHKKCITSILLNEINCNLHTLIHNLMNTQPTTTTIQQPNQKSINNPNNKKDWRSIIDIVLQNNKQQSINNDSEDINHNIFQNQHTINRMVSRLVLRYIRPLSYSDDDEFSSTSSSISSSSVSMMDVDNISSSSSSTSSSSLSSSVSVIDIDNADNQESSVSIVDVDNVSNNTNSDDDDSVIDNDDSIDGSNIISGSNSDSSTSKILI